MSLSYYSLIYYSAAILFNLLPKFNPDNLQTVKPITIYDEFATTRTQIHVYGMVESHQFKELKIQT